MNNLNRLLNVAPNVHRNEFRCMMYLPLVIDVLRDFERKGMRPVKPMKLSSSLSTLLSNTTADGYGMLRLKRAEVIMKNVLMKYKWHYNERLRQFEKFDYYGNVTQVVPAAKGEFTCPDDVICYYCDVKYPKNYLDCIREGIDGCENINMLENTMQYLLKWFNMSPEVNAVMQLAKRRIQSNRANSRYQRKSFEFSDFSDDDADWAY